MFKRSRKLLILVLSVLLVAIVTALYFVIRSNSKQIEVTDLSAVNETPISAPVSYVAEEIVKEEPKQEAKVEGASTVAAAPVQPIPQSSHALTELPPAVNVPVVTQPDPKPVPPEVIQDDKCSDPKNTWLEFQLGSTDTQQFGGSGMEYTYMQDSGSRIDAFPSYSCIDRSEFIEMWYNATLEQFQCYCGTLRVSGIQPGTYQMIYILGVRNVVYYDYITLIVTPKPKPNSIPNAVILTPHGYFETKIIEGNTYTFDLYGEMQDEEDGVVNSGSSLKWYRTDFSLDYLFDGSGSYTVEVPNCSTVQVTLTLRVWDSQGTMDDETFTVKLKNENCVVTP